MTEARKYMNMLSDAIRAAEMCRESQCTKHSGYNPRGHVENITLLIEYNGISDYPQNISGFNKVRLNRYKDNSGILQYELEPRTHYVNFGHSRKGKDLEGNKVNEISFPTWWLEHRKQF